MKWILFFLLLPIASFSQTFYIVRHAEKEMQSSNNPAMMTNDPPLTAAGKQRAIALKEILKNKEIGYIFSTNTIRTRSTAQPTADHFHLQIETYGPAPDSFFIAKLKSLKKNVLIVGHSNTVDDIVNMLCGKKEVAGDLPDSEYSKLFIVTIQKQKIFFKERSIPAK